MKLPFGLEMAALKSLSASVVPNGYRCWLFRAPSFQTLLQVHVLSRLFDFMIIPMPQAVYVRD